MATESKPAELKAGLIPPSCLGPDGKFRHGTEEEHKVRMESARWRLREIAEIPTDPDDPPERTQTSIFRAVGQKVPMLIPIIRSGPIPIIWSEPLGSSSIRASRSEAHC